MNHKLKDKKQKIGLVLGGGGAKGAYQAGVLKALKEANILSYVTHVSANSIGSINALMVVDEKIEGCAEVWKTISKKDALKLKSKSEKGGIFSRNGLIKILENNIDFDHVSQSDKKLYITAFNKDTQKIEYFLANGKTKEEILSYTLASSAIPYVYAPVKIGEHYYSDGFKDNVPVRVLKNAGCDVIIIIGLRPEYHPTPEELEGISVIDFTPPYQLGTSRFDALDFKPANIEFRLKNGYLTAKKILDNIKDDEKNPFYEKGAIKRVLSRLFKSKIIYNSYPNYYYRLDHFDVVGQLNPDKSAKDEIMEIIDAQMQ